MILKTDDFILLDTFNNLTIQNRNELLQILLNIAATELLDNKEQKEALLRFKSQYESQTKK